MHCHNSFHGIFLQFLSYSLVGGLAFVVDYGSLWLLTEKCHLYYLISAAIAFLLGLTVNYLLSTTWVFTERKYNN